MTATRSEGTDIPAGRAEILTFGGIKLADLLIPRLLGRFRFCPQLGWIQFDGNKWLSDAEDAVTQEVGETVKDYAAAAAQSTTRIDREFLADLKNLSSGGVATYAMKLARGAKGIATDIRLFDARPNAALGEPYRIHCANGWTIQLFPDGSYSTRPTLADDLNTRVACAYDPDATAPRTAAAWKQYQPDDEIRRFQLQQFARGLSGMGSETFTAWYGPRAGNGKSTVETVITAVAGEYAQKLPVELLLKQTKSARETYRNELAEMRAARIVFASEPEEGAKFNLGIIKDITGGAPITGRENYRQQVTFTPHILLTLLSNNRPGWSSDKGMERRYIEMPWDFEIPAERQRKSFKDELAVEAPGVLNAIIANWPGAGATVIPDVVRNQTRTGVRESSPIAQFIAEGLDRAENAKTAADQIFKGYEEWCRQNNERALSSTKFGREMVRLGIEKVKAGCNFYLGVAVNDDYRPRGSGGSIHSGWPAGAERRSQSGGLEG